MAAKPRTATVKRKTKETDIEVAVSLDGTGRRSVATGIGFLDHMLDLLARHSRIDITVKAKGDLHIDHHHTTEDVGIALGQAVKQALGDMKGITRYADVHVPMDEALTRVAIDVSGPAVPGVQGRVRPRQGRRVRHRAGAANGSRLSPSMPAITLHVETLYGTNDHHIAEVLLQGFGAGVAGSACDRSARGQRSAVDQGHAGRVGCTLDSALSTRALRSRASGDAGSGSRQSIGMPRLASSG